PIQPALWRWGTQALILRTFTILRLVAGTFACRLILGASKPSFHLLKSLQKNSYRLPNVGKTYSRIRHARVLLYWLAEHRMPVVSMRKRRIVWVQKYAASPRLWEARSSPRRVAA